MWRIWRRRRVYKKSEELEEFELLLESVDLDEFENVQGDMRIQRKCKCVCHRVSLQCKRK